MRLPTLGARGVLCAVALALAASPALADHKKKKPKAKPPRVSVADCTTFDQRDREDESIDLVIGSSCEVPVACSVSWTLVCAPGTRQSRKSNHGEAFTLVAAQVQSTNASADTCGNSGWVIDDVVWACNPQSPPAAQ